MMSCKRCNSSLVCSAAAISRSIKSFCHCSQAWRSTAQSRALRSLKYRSAITTNGHSPSSSMVFRSGISHVGHKKSAVAVGIGMATAPHYMGFDDGSKKKRRDRGGGCLFSARMIVRLANYVNEEIYILRADYLQKITSDGSNQHRQAYCESCSCRATVAGIFGHVGW